MDDIKIGLDTSFIVTTIQADRDTLTRTLDSLQKYLEDKCNWEVVVVNNGEVDFDDSWTTKYPVFKFVNTDERMISYAYAVNYGARLTDDSLNHLCILHDDIEFLQATDVVPMLCSLGLEDDHGFKVGLVLPKSLHKMGYANQTYYIFHKSEHSPTVELQQHRRYWYKEALELSEDSFVLGGPSGFYVITKELWNKMEGFDEKYKPFFGEDIDFCLKLIRHKYCSYFMHKIMYLHHVGTTTNKFQDSNMETFSKHMQYIVNDFKDVVEELTGERHPDKEESSELQ